MTNTHNDIQIGDRVIGRSNGSSFLAGELGTVVESPNSVYPFAVRFDNEDKFPERLEQTQKGIRHWRDAAFFEPTPIKVGDWVRVISVANGGNTDKIGHKFKVLEINHYGTVTETKPDWGYGGTTWSQEHLRAIAEPFEPVEVGIISNADGPFKVDIKNGAIFFDMAPPNKRPTLFNLAQTIHRVVPGEPLESETETIIERAMRIIDSQQAQNAELNSDVTDQRDALTKAAGLLRDWIAMKIPGTGDRSRHWLNKYAPKRPFKRGDTVTWGAGGLNGIIVGPAPTKEEPFEVVVINGSCIGKFVTPALTDLRHVE